MESVDFKDLVDISSWALEAVAYCGMKGVINGKPGDFFDPKGNATRAEFATMLIRFLGAVETK